MPEPNIQQEVIKMENLIKEEDKQFMDGLITKDEYLKRIENIILQHHDKLNRMSHQYDEWLKRHE